MESEDIRVRVAQHYIANTPVGELPDVIRDLRKLAGDEVVDDSATRAAVLEHHVKHCTVVPAGDLKLVISKFGRRGDTFVDPKLLKVFSVDPYEQIGQVLEDVQEEANGVQAEIQGKLDSYLSEYYTDAQGRVYKSEAGYDIVITAHFLNLRNFWTGEWVSQWSVVGSHLEGEIAFRAHYFEDGNLQMNHEKRVSQTLQASLETSVVSAIISLESEVYAQLESVYDMMSQSCFKAMRRSMPVTGTRFADIHASKMLR